MGEVGAADAPPHPPVAAATGPSLSPSGRGTLAAVALVLGLFTLAGVAAADEAAPAACTGIPGVAAPEPGAAAVVAAWSDNAAWRPPSCTDWTARGFRLLVAVAASFRSDAGIDDLLARFGAVSSLADVRFWSPSDRAWKPLVENAGALDGSGTARADFTPAEIKDGRPFFFVQGGGETGDIVNRARVVDASPDRLVVEAQNVTPIKFSLIQLFGPGDLQTLYSFERRSPGVWTYHGLTRVGRGSSFLVAGHTDSFANRALALYRHFAGLPAASTPPLAARS